MANILIIGAGSMGTAFAFPCSDNNHNVSIVGTHLEDDFIDQINSKKKHPYLNCDIPKGVNFLKYINLSEFINKKIDLIVIAVASKGIEWASKELSKILKNNTPILLLTKGLAINNNSYEVLAHKMKRLLKSNGINISDITAAGGPCLAYGLSNRVHTSVVFANDKIETAQLIAKLVSTEYYHVFSSDDVIGVETCAAVKNIFSMAIGAAEGLCNTKLSVKNIDKAYLNTSASLIQQSINEMIIFTESVKGKKETVFGLAGIGDLYVSADGGRNSQMGYYIGQGMSFIDAKKNKMPNDTIEGAELILEIGNKVKSDFNINKLPIMVSMIDTIIEKKSLIINWSNFK